MFDSIVSLGDRVLSILPFMVHDCICFLVVVFPIVLFCNVGCSFDYRISTHKKVVTYA